jgi:GntR family transcriptional regulator
MRFPVDPKSPIPLHVQIADGIQLAIARAELGSGDQLPTVRQLSVDLKVNSNTIARVYADLERAGVLESRRGKGTFVATTCPVSTAAIRARRLHALCREFTKACLREGFSLAQVRAELEQLKHRREE